MRAYGLVGCTSLMLFAGCAAPNPRSDAPRPEIAPLTDPEFDLFAERIAYAIRARLDFFSGSTTATIIRPSTALHADAPPAADSADQIDRAKFAEALLAAVSDRLAGRVTFVQAAPARYRSRIDFMPPVAGRGWIEFAMIDPVTQRDVARERAEYSLRQAAAWQSAPARRDRPDSTAGQPSRDSKSRTPDSAAMKSSAAVPRNEASPGRPRHSADPKSAAADRRADSKSRAADTPGKDSSSASHAVDALDPGAAGDGSAVSIEMTDADLARAADGLAGRRPFSAWSTSLDHGKVVFLNEKSWSDVEFTHHDATHADGSPIRAEFCLAAHSGGRCARVRVVFFDAQNRRVEVTPVLEYGLRERYPLIVAVTARDSRAARFVALVQVD